MTIEFAPAAGTAPVGQTRSLATNKACEACRSAKIRCHIAPGSSNCQRCTKAGRECIFNLPQTRKRRVQNPDARVAELERQIKVLKSRLNKQQTRVGPSNDDLSIPRLQFQAPVTPDQWQIRHSSNSSPEYTAEHDNDPRKPARLFGVISMETAELLLARYRSHFEIQYPFVITSANSTLVDLHGQCPLTLLAILTGTSASLDLDLHQRLNEELLKVSATAIMLESGRSLDLVQAMIVAAVWYSPTERLESLKHYKYAHLAATIAMDLDTHGAEYDLEYRRALLSCYFLCTGIAIAMGRPTLIQYNDNIKNNTAMLALPTASIHDRRLAAWVVLQSLAENIVQDFFSNPLDITDPDVRKNVESACATLDQWKSQLSFPLEGSMRVHYFQVQSRILCVCLYPDHPLEDFRPPFRVRSIGSRMSSTPEISPFYVRVSMNLVAALHGALDSILAMSPLDLLIAPVITYARTCHAMSVLLMMGIAVLQRTHALSKIMDLSSLRIEHYFDKVRGAVERAGEINNHKTPTRFCGIISNMQLWWDTQKTGISPNSGDLRPFLSTTEVPTSLNSSEHILISAEANQRRDSDVGSHGIDQIDRLGFPEPFTGSSYASTPDSFSNQISYEFGELPDLDWSNIETLFTNDLAG